VYPGFPNWKLDLLDNFTRRNYNWLLHFHNWYIYDTQTIITLSRLTHQLLNCLERRVLDESCRKSKSKLCYDRRSVSHSVLMSSTHLGRTTRFLLLRDNCGFVDVGRSLSLTRERICDLQLLLFLASAVILGWLVTIFYCLRFETPPTWRARSPYLYPPATGWPSYTLRHWVPFSSPSTTRLHRILSNSLHYILYRLGTDHIQNTISIVDETCLLLVA
jgi:hypothetical protein